MSEKPKASASDAKPDESPSEQMTVRAYAEAKNLRRWQVVLLEHRIGLDKVMAASAIAEALEKFSKERV